MLHIMESEHVLMRWRAPMSREKYDEMLTSGVFAENERIELLRGVVVTMSPHTPWTDGVTGRLHEMLARALGDRAFVRCQLSLVVGDHSVPEPDIAAVPRRNYDRDHPTWAHLVAEVSYSSYDKDRNVKADLYAEARIPEYWIVDLDNDAIEVFTNPDGKRYRELRVLSRTDRIRLAEFPDVEIAIADVLPAPGTVPR